MAMMLGSGGGGRRGRRTMNAEINVTPFVDVMLVLLIVFMITAPLLVRGEEVTLPKTSSGALAAATSQPLSITVTKDGRIFLNEENEVAPEDLITQLVAITGEGYDQLIYLRADTDATHGQVMEVTALVRAAGFTRIAFVTDPRGRGGP
ncbi:MAG: ExbD/TolR family protein [Hyphomonadaceae bacterium]|nr:ExbD/TolR family protein [Hyphomonadaceae bacterium]